jgi:hypothetical protein
MARFLQRSLETEGYSVELAFDGEEALNIGEISATVREVG